MFLQHIRAPSLTSCGSGPPCHFPDSQAVLHCSPTTFVALACFSVHSIYHHLAKSIYYFPCLLSSPSACQLHKGRGLSISFLLYSQC